MYEKKICCNLCGREQVVFVVTNGRGHEFIKIEDLYIKFRKKGSLYILCKSCIDKQ